MSSFSPVEDREFGEFHADGEEFLVDFGEPFDDGEFEELGIDPAEPTHAKPGSEDKVMTLAARYAAGLPLWHQDDCYDHTPAQKEDGEELSLDG